MTNPGTSGLVGYWSMDELDNSTARADKVSLIGDLTVSANPTPSDMSKYGVGTNLVAAHSDYLIGPTGGLAQMGNFQFEMGGWIRLHGISATGRIIGKWTAAGKEYLLYYYSVDRYIYFIIYNGGNYSIGASSFGQLAIQKWYYVHGYHDSVANTVGVGVNDVWNTASGGTGGAAAGSTAFTIGCDADGSTDQFNGIVDEMFLYRQRLLTSAERTWLYNDGLGRSYFDIAASEPPSLTIEQPGAHDKVLVHILDSDLAYAGVVDDYYNLIWTERFNDAGDFEMEAPFKYSNHEYLTFGNYLYIPTSDRLMMIEQITPTHAEDRDAVIIKGESIEAILKKRTLKKISTVPTDDNGYGQAELMAYKMMWENLTMPVENNDGDTNKKIAIFSEDYPKMNGWAIWQEQLEQGASLYESIQNICKNSIYRDFDVLYIWMSIKGLGFHVFPDIPNAEFYFYVYEGADRTAEVFFSRDWHNVKSSSVYETVTDMVSMVRVITEDVTYPDVWVWSDGSSEGPTGTEPTDIDRIEKVIELSIDRTAETPNLTDAEVLNIIINEGQKEIRRGYNALFEGEFDLNLGGWVYGVDFFMGDIVRCDLAGKAADARIIEVVRTYGLDGRTGFLTMDFDLYQLGQ